MLVYNNSQEIKTVESQPTQRHSQGTIETVEDVKTEEQAPPEVTHKGVYDYSRFPRPRINFDKKEES